MRKIDVKKLKHPYEKFSLILAYMLILPIVGILIYLTINVSWVVLIPIALVILIYMFFYKLFKAKINGGSIKVNKYNFPEINEVLEEAKELLDYRKNVDIYIFEGGSVKAFFYSVFSDNMIIFNSDLVDSMKADKYRKEYLWLISRYIGAIQARHTRFDYILFMLNTNIISDILDSISDVFESFEKLWVLNIFFFPYNRAIQYTGDQVGLACCGSLEDTINIFNKLLIGKDISNKVNIKGVILQADQLNKSFFGSVSILFSKEPHMVKRYVNILSFCRSKYPEKYAAYINTLTDIDPDVLNDILDKQVPYRKLKKVKNKPEKNDELNNNA